MLIILWMWNQDQDYVLFWVLIRIPRCIKSDSKLQKMHLQILQLPVCWIDYLTLKFHKLHLHLSLLHFRYRTGMSLNSLCGATSLEIYLQALNLDSEVLEVELNFFFDLLLLNLSSLQLSSKAIDMINFPVFKVSF